MANIPIQIFKKNEKEDYLAAALEVEKWLRAYEVKKKYGKAWAISSGAGSAKGDQLANTMTDRSIYSGAAGVGFFYIQLYKITGEEKYLEDARQAAEYLIGTYAEANGRKPGIHGGITGEGLFTEELFQITGDVKYRNYAIKVGDDAYTNADKTGGFIKWDGITDYMGDGSVIAYWLMLAEITGDDKYKKYAKQFLDYIITFANENEDGTAYWNLLDIHNYFQELPPEGIVPNFAHGTAGIVYLLTLYYESTKEGSYLELAKKGFRFLENIAVRGASSAIVPYLYWPKTKEHFDVFYLSLCHGPVGDAVVAKELYKATNEEHYLAFYKKFSNALVEAGVTYKRSPGYWNDCICCGSSGVLLHFVDGYKLTKDVFYKETARKIADKLIGDAFRNKEGIRWYNAWTRVMPWNVDAHIGLYMGSAGAASALLSLYGALEGITIPQISEFADKRYNEEGE